MYDDNSLNAAPTIDEMTEIGLRVHPLIIDLEDDLGSDAVTRLLETRGGRTVYLPRLASSVPNSRVACELGEDVAQWLFDRLGGGNLCIPCGTMSNEARRKVMALRLFRRGASLSEVAAHTGTHLMTASKYRRRFKRRGLLTDEAS